MACFCGSGISRLASFVCLSFIACLCSLITAGCQKNDRKIAVLVYMDRSGSITGYPHGGLAGIQRDYSRVATAYIKPLMQESDDVRVETREFVSGQETLFTLQAKRWEQVWKKLKPTLAFQPYPADEEHRTLFSRLIHNVHEQCREYEGREVYVLVLTDGHPDERFDGIYNAATAFAADDPGNLRSILIAPVEPNIRYRWREKLSEALRPIGSNVLVANITDYRTVIADAFSRSTDEENVNGRPEK